MNQAIADLTDAEADAVGGAADGYYYEGQLYSLGSIVSTPAGRQTCMFEGATGRYYWSKPERAPRNIK